MTLAAPVYTIGADQPNGVQQYCLGTGIYPGYVVGLGGTGSLHTAITALEAHLGWNIEAIGVSANGQGIGNTVNNLANCPQFIVYSFPLVPLNTGSIHTGLAGGYDSAIDAFFTALVAAGINGNRVSVRAGWEMNSEDGSGFTFSIGYHDPNTGVANGLTNVKNMFTRVVTRARAVGYNGYFELNFGTTDGSLPGISSWFTDHTDKKIIAGYDCYNSISNAYHTTGGVHDFGYGMDDFASVWTNEIKPQLDSITTYCRTWGLLAGMGEFGQIYTSTNPYHTNDGSLYYANMAAYFKANSDVWAYAILFNQNQYSGSNVTEDDQLFYSGSAAGTGPTVKGTGPTPNNASMGTLVNGTTTGSVWVDTPSINKTLALASYKANFVAGSMQSDPPVAPPIVLPVTGNPLTAVNKVHNTYAPFG